MKHYYDNRWYTSFENKIPQEKSPILVYLKGKKKNYLLSGVLESAKLKLLVLSSNWKIFALEESLTYMFVPARSQEMKLSDFQLNNTLSQLSGQNVADIIEGA